jgi:hypothetical protein
VRYGARPSCGTILPVDQRWAFVWVVLAALPPAVLLIHLHFASLPSALVAVLVNYDFFLWLLALDAARRTRRSHRSRSTLYLIAISSAGVIGSGLYLLTLVGLCGPSVLWFDCRA